MGRTPFAYGTTARLFSSHAESLATSLTDVCIEAPPGSGNSFIVQAFSLANPDVRIAHHHHVPAQVLSAAKQGIPTLVILRNPIDCVLARVPDLQNLSMIGPNLRMWIGFWVGVSGVLDRIAVTTFEDLVADPRGPIELINRRFETKFKSVLPSTDHVFEIMRSHRAASPSLDRSIPHPNVPDARKAARKDAIRPYVYAHRAAPKAQRLYQRLREELRARTV